MPEMKIVNDHHEVLTTWHRFKGINVISLDYHTDTKLAFQNYVYRYINGKNNDETIQLQKQKSFIEAFQNGSKTIDECIGYLRNDEHIDFAVRTKIVNKAYIIHSMNTGGSNGSVNRCIFDNKHQKNYNGHSIIEYGTTTQHNIDDNFLSPARDYIIQYVPDFYDNYILDFDLDYFNSINVFQNPQLSVLKGLIENAKFITIAREFFFLKILNWKMIQ